MRHLIAHTSGLAFDSEEIWAVPGTKWIYSHTGFAVLADAVAAASGIRFADYLAEGAFGPLRMTAPRLDGPAGFGGVSTCADLTRFAAELQVPTLLAPQTLAKATQTAYPGLDGVLPGYGMQRPNDWGLGFELGAHKSPACVALTDHDVDQWAKDAWPMFSDEVLAELA